MKKFTDRAMMWLVASVALLGTGAAAVTWTWPEYTSRGAVPGPTLSALEMRGEDAFNGTCAQCHGNSAAGTAKGPPLIHDIYNPGHHGDEAFVRAAKRGVPQHHWPFGNMPAQPQISDGQLAAIVRYVRELQQANGILYKPHAM